MNQLYKPGSVPSRTVTGHRKVMGRLLLMTLLLFAFIGGAKAQETLTVYDNGTDKNSYVPFYGLYADTQGAASEFVIPADVLEEMSGGTISSVTFYLSTSAAEAWTGTHQVYIGEVDATTLTGITGPGSFTVVKTASFDATGTELTVEFDDPYTYEGGNLLIGTYVSAAGNWKSAYFTGVNQTENTGWYRSSTTAAGSAVQFLPKTTFTYEPAPAGDCERPSNFVATEVLARQATFTWESEVGLYAFEYKKATASDWSAIEIDNEEGGITANTFTLTGLEQNTAYSARVMAICGDESVSGWRTVSFTTPISCPDPTGVNVIEFDAHSATIEWTAEDGVNYVCALVKTDDYDAETVVLESHPNPVTFTGLDPETQYTFALRKVCGGDDGVSQIVTTSFTTTIACPAPTELAATLTPGNGSKATLSWTSGATEWVVAYKTADQESFTEINVSENPYTLTGLTPETTYNVKVKAVCGGIDGESQWSSTISFTPTDAYQLTVNDGSTTNGYVPVYGYWADKYSKSQFIIPAEDLAGMAYGTITKLTFYSSNTAVNWGNAEFEVYMTEVDNTSFESESASLIDWTTMDKVMNAGSLSIVDNKMEVTLDAPYQYLGRNLLIGILQTTSGTYSSSTWYGVASDNNVALGGYETSKAIGFQKFLPKTTFDFEPGEAPACAKPYGLSINYEGGTTAEVSWTSDATAWNIDVNGTVTNITENPYTLTGLELATDYEIKVQADCGGGATSDWTNPVNFTTDECLNPTIINYSLVDSYGDGWNGNGINVIDDEDDVIATLTIASGSSATGAIKICGDYARFEWVKGSYPGEASWTFTDANGVELFSGTGTTDMVTGDLLYEIDNSACPKPTDLEASEIGARSVVLSWTEKGEATAWQICLNDDEDNLIPANSNPFTVTGLTPDNTVYTAKVRATKNGIVSKWSKPVTFITDIAFPAPDDLAVSDITATSATIDWTTNDDVTNAVLQYGIAEGAVSYTEYKYDNGENASAVGLSGNPFSWGVMFPAGSYEGNSLKKASVYDYAEMTGSVTIYNDGDTEPSNAIGTKSVSLTGTEAFVDFDFNDLEIDNTKNVWVIFHFESGATYPAATCQDELDDPNGRWVEINGSWYDLANAGVTGQAFMVRAEIGTADYSLVDWTTVENATSPYELTGLNENTDYIVRVKSIYGTEGESKWTTTSFKTLELYPAPTDLVATEVGPYSAKLSWTENGTATEWVIVVYDQMEDDYLDGNEDGIITSKNPYTLTGLIPEHDYVVNVRPAGENLSWSAPLYFTTVFTAPTDLAAEALATTADISWTGFAESYEMEYGIGSSSTGNVSYDFEDGTLQGWTNLIVNDEGGQWLHSDNQPYGHDYTDLAHDGTGFALCYSFIDYDGAYDTNAYLVSPEQYQIGSSNATLHFWYDMANDSYPEPFDVCVATAANPTALDFTSIWSFSNAKVNNGEKAKVRQSNNRSGNWREVTIDLSAYTGQSIWIAFHDVNEDAYEVWIDDITIDTGASTDIEWIPVNDPINATQYTLTGLTPETTYTVRVRAIYDEGESDWTYTTFTTLEDNPVPFNIEADLAADGANLTWEGEGDSYNVRYRTLESKEYVFFEDFENGIPETWTTIDADGDGYEWFAWSPSGDVIDGQGNPMVMGTTCATSASYASGALTPDNWLITPQLNLEGTLSVWLRGQDPGWASENFAIYISTTGTGVDDFTELVPETTAEAVYTEYTADLSDYAGQTGYIAIRHFNVTDMFRLNVDNFGIYTDSTPAGEWETIATNDAAATLSGLTTNNGYEYQVQSVKDEATSEWSESGEFALLSLDNDATNNTSLLINNLGRQAHVTLTNRTLFKDGNWNTLTLPFDVDLTDEEGLLYGATAKTLDNATVTPKRVSLSFGAAETTLSAGTPYIIKWAEDSPILNPAFANVTIATTTAETISVAGGDVNFVGYYDAFGIDADDEDIYYLTGNNTLKRTGTNRTLKSCRAYFQFAGVAIDAREFTLDFGDGETTGIIAIEGEQQNNAAGWYTVDGKKLDKQPTRKGVYIQDGRKVVIK